MRYLRLSRAAMNQEDGSILVLDILGGHAGESSVKLRRQNDISGTDFSLHSNCSGTKKVVLAFKMCMYQTSLEAAISALTSCVGAALNLLQYVADAKHRSVCCRTVIFVGTGQI